MSELQLKISDAELEAKVIPHPAMNAKTADPIVLPSLQPPTSLNSLLLTAQPLLMEVVGMQGPAGPGVPAGGSAGQILRKVSDTDYDTEWSIDIDMYQVNDLDEEGSVTYVGKARNSGEWLIERVTESGEDLAKDYANESNNGAYTTYSTAWANRATLTYANFETLTGL